MARNHLTRGHQRKLQDLILQRKSDIESGRYNMGSFADLASKVLGLVITQSNVRGALRDLEGAEIPVKFPSQEKAKHRFQNTQSIVESIRVLASDLVQLRGHLGDPASPAIQALAEGSGEE